MPLSSKKLRSIPLRFFSMFKSKKIFKGGSRILFLFLLIFLSCFFGGKKIEASTQIVLTISSSGDISGLPTYLGTMNSWGGRGTSGLYPSTSYESQGGCVGACTVPDPINISNCVMSPSVGDYTILWKGATYLCFAITTGTEDYYTLFHYDGISWTGDSSNSRIVSLTYATSTGYANVTGYWNTHATSSERLSFWQQSSSLGVGNYAEYYATSTGYFNFSFFFAGLPTPWSGGTTTVAVMTSFTLNAKIDEVYSDFDPFTGEGTAPNTLDATSTLVSTLSYTGTDYSTASGIFELPEYECGITSITGWLKNAFQWRFYPASDSIAKFTTLSVAEKFPFKYAYQLGAIRTALFSASSTAPTSITVSLWKLPSAATTTIELISKTKIQSVPFAGTIYNILTWLIWLGMAEYIYYRIIRTHDTNTPS